MTSGTFEWRLPGDQGVETQSLMDQLMMATDQPDCWTRVLEHLARQVDVSPKQLVDWYDRAIASIPTSINRKNPQYAILCLDWALAYRNHEGVEEGLLKMKWIAANKVGVDLARTWIQRAQFEFEVGHHDKARKYVLEGIAKKAQPEHALEEFLVKVTNHTLEAKEFLCFPPLKDSASTPFTTGTVSSHVSSSSASSKSSKRSSCTMVEMMESQDNVIRSTKPSLVSVLDKENIIAPSRSNFKSNGQRKPLQAKPMGSTNSKPDEHRKVLFKKPSEDETKVKKSFFVHGKKYIVKEQVGKGGSGTVFKVYDDDLEVFALKKVKLDASDDKRMESLRNEISLLEKLRAKPQIIQLYSWEIDEESEHLLMVFEYGQTDLAKLLKKKKNFSLNYVRTLWEQMLQAVQTIHEERIVHGDLKPANFLFVGEELKLIDFGISKAIQNDTTHIERDSQIGTVNYMSPEAIKAFEGGDTFKLGRASDIWSLGCILYQLVYGKTPFQDISKIVTKLYCIVDPNYEIKFEDSADAMAIDAMRQCLDRDPRRRPSIPQLLEHPFLNPSAPQV